MVLDIIGNNIANANTPGYHRQVVQLANVTPMRIDNLSIGRGVEVTGISRLVAKHIEDSKIRQSAATGASESHLSVATQLESRLANEKASPGKRLEALFNQLELLSSQLNSSSARKQLVASADQMTREFQSLSSDLVQQRDAVDQSIEAVIQEINPLANRIGQLNAEIARQTNLGGPPNDLLDQRAQAIQELSQRINIDLQVGNQGQITVIAGDAPLVISERSLPLVVVRDADNQPAIRALGSDRDLSISGGQLGGLLTARNSTLPKYQARLDDLARTVIQEFNSVHATGVGLNGAFSTLTSQESVTDVNQMLASTGLPRPPMVGSVIVAVTNTATGQRTLNTVNIDPAKHSLTDVAGEFSAVPNLQAFVNSQFGTLSIMSAPGFTFDFRGGVQSPQTTMFSAGTTTTPTVAGTFNGNINDRFHFAFSGDGTVGVTPGLKVQVTDQAGDTVASLDIGQGYEVGQPLAVAEGVTLSLASGTVATGDSFDSDVIGQPDSSGLLNALGLNAFFTGRDAATMTISRDLLSNPERLATSRSGQPGDTTNLQRLVALRDAPVMRNQTTTMTDDFIQTVADVGTDVRNLTDLHETNQLLSNRLEEQLQSVSGVDPNEEMVNLLKYQRMFQIASKYLNLVNSTYDELLSIR